MLVLLHISVIYDSYQAFINNKINPRCTAAPQWKQRNYISKYNGKQHHKRNSNTQTLTNIGQQIRRLSGTYHMTSQSANDQKYDSMKPQHQQCILA
jgi:hypothetical protein